MTALAITTIPLPTTGKALAAQYNKDMETLQKQVKRFWRDKHKSDVSFPSGAIGHSDILNVCKAYPEHPLSMEYVEALGLDSDILRTPADTLLSVLDNPLSVVRQSDIVQNREADRLNELLSEKEHDFEALHHRFEESDKLLKEAIEQKQTLISELNNIRSEFKKTTLELASLSNDVAIKKNTIESLTRTLADIRTDRDRQTDIIKTFQNGQTDIVQTYQTDKSKAMSELSDRYDLKLSEKEKALSDMSEAHKQELRTLSDKYELKLSEQQRTHERELKLVRQETDIKLSELQEQFDTELDKERTMIRAEHAAQLEADKEKFFFEKPAFVKISLVILTVIQIYVSGMFLNIYLKIDMLALSLLMAVPIPFGGLLATIFLSESGKDNRYLGVYSGALAVIELATFIPFCTDNSQYFGVVVYVAVMVLLTNIYGRVYLKIK